MRIDVPLFRDINTNPYIDAKLHLEASHAHPSNSQNGNGHSVESVSWAKPNNIYMDAMGFGMGCCCLQVY